MVIEKIAPVVEKDLEDYFKKYAAYSSGKELAPQVIQTLISKVDLPNITDEPGRTEKIAAKALQIAKTVL